ncbi:MAG: LysR family transcriptional regulator [Candidatus Accumulibacter sp.]|jgi:DNA-binding transcriptional LysR family regulator|nr:LysR family transcriptional regulator [Accumulibacter sp.]
MRIRHLRYFLAVAEELSFTRAAPRVHIEPSPLSRAIRELESDLQVQLFHHAPGQLRLTPAGKVFRDEACRLLVSMEGARSRARSVEQGYRGQLRIGLADRLAQPQFIRLLARCREEEPHTEIKIQEMTFREMIEALKYEQIDAGFTVHPEPVRKLRKEAVWWDRFAVAVPRNHPLLSYPKIPLHKVTRFPLLLFHPEACSGYHDLIRRKLLDVTASSPTVAEYVAGYEAMMMLAAAGYGIGVGLESQITGYRYPEVIVRPIADDLPSLATFLVVPERKPSGELSHFVTRVRQIGRKTAIHRGPDPTIFVGRRTPNVRGIRAKMR